MSAARTTRLSVRWALAAGRVFSFRSAPVHRWVLGAAAAMTLSCSREPAQDPTVRFDSRPTGVNWTTAPTTPAERAAEATKLAARGQKLLESGELLGGVAHLRRAADLAPAEPSLRNQLAQGFERLGDADAALTILRETLESHPKDAATLFALGRLVRATENRRALPELEAAIAAWKQLLAQAPTGADAATITRELPVLEKRRDALRAKQPPAPGKAAAAALGGQRPTSPTQRIESTQSAAPLKSPTTPTLPTPTTPPTTPTPPNAPPPSPGESAQPADADDAVMAGNSFLERGQFAEAAASYQRALRQRPDPETRWLLGLAHERAGKLAEAAKAWAPLASSLEGRRKAQYEAARKATP